MKKRLILFLAVILTTALLCGCAKKAADDAADTVSSVVSDVKEDAEQYGTTNDDTDGRVDEDNGETQPTITDMDKMIENGAIDDENNDNTDGDNVDDDQNAQDDRDSGEDHADGGEHNDETTGDDNSAFI